MNPLELFETDRLVLSGWQRDQLDDLVRLHSDPQVARYLAAHGKPWSLIDMVAALNGWIELFNTRRMGKLRVTRKADGVLVGRCGFGIHQPTGEPELGYALYPEFQGNGYASEAAAGMRDWLFRETSWDHFLGIVDTRNTASLNILHGLGMVDTHTEADSERMLQFLILNKDAA